MKIAVLLGSIRLGRQSHKAAHYLVDQWNRVEGVEVSLIDLSVHRLPMMEERYNMHPNPPALVNEIGAELEAADAVVFMSPEYNGSYSGVLKNAVDYFARHAISGKPVGVVATSAGPLGGINASHRMQDLVLAIGAYPMPYKLLLPQVHTAFDEQHLVQDEKTEAAVRKFIEEFTWFARALVQGRAEREKTPSAALAS